MDAQNYFLKANQLIRVFKEALLEDDSPGVLYVADNKKIKTSSDITFTESGHIDSLAAQSISAQTLNVDTVTIDEIEAESANVSGPVNVFSLTSQGLVSGGSLNIIGGSSTGPINAMGNITASGNVLSSGEVSGVSGNFTGSVTVGNALSVANSTTLSTLTVTNTSTLNGVMTVNANSTIKKCRFGDYELGDFASFKHVDTNLSNGYSIMQDASGRTIVNSGTGQPLEFRIGNTTHMGITSDGRIGIGTLPSGTPFRKFTVVGDSRFDNGVSIGGNLLGSGGMTMNGTSQFNNNLTAAQNFTVGNNTMMNGTLTVGGLSSLSAVSIAGAATLNTSLSVAQQSTLTGNVSMGSNLTVTGTLTSNGAAQINSNATVTGVLTSNTLQVTNNATVIGNLNVVGQISGAGDLMRFPPSVSGEINRTVINGAQNVDRFLRFRNGGGAPSGNAGVQFSSFDEHNFYVYAAGAALSFFYNPINSNVKNDFGTQLMTLRINGDLGLGINAPAQKLHVVGSGAITDNLGVGTTAPSQRLHVVGSALLTQGLFRQFDDRNLRPNDAPPSTTTFGFGSYLNNNAAPWADVIHLNNWGDSGGGNPSALMVNRSGFGIRQWKGTFNSNDPYLEAAGQKRDCCMATYDQPMSRLVTGTQTLQSNTNVFDYVYGHGMLGLWENVLSIEGVYKYTTQSIWNKMPPFNGITGTINTTVPYIIGINSTNLIIRIRNPGGAGFTFDFRVVIHYQE